MTKKFVFEFSIMDDVEFVYTDGVVMSYDEAGIKKFAEILKGKSEEYMAADLPLGVQQPIIEAIIDQYAEKIENELELDLQEISYHLTGPIPVNLLHVCNEINGIREEEPEYDFSFDPSVDCGDSSTLIRCTVKYVVRHEGREYVETCDYALDAKIVDAMLHLSETKPAGISDFAYLKLMAPEMFDYVESDISGWSNNKHLREWGTCEPIELSEFPVEIYEYYV